MTDPHEIVGDALERLEWADQRRDIDAPPYAALTRRRALTGGAAAIAASMLAACGSAADGADHAPKSPVVSIFGIKGGYRFTFVNHQTGSPFFTPTINGITDACALLNCAYEWVGSSNGQTGAMASALATAASARVDGIATTMISPELAGPVDAAVAAGIPVVAYNADDPGSRRLAYVGQNLLEAGREMGRKIESLLPDGGKVMVFIATPGIGNLAPRLTGAEQALAGSAITVRSQASGVSEDQEMATITEFIGTNLDAYQGYFAVDAGSTAAVATAIQKNNLTGKVVGGGFDLLPETQQLLYEGTIQFAIDQQPYLQGFLPTLQLFLHRATGGLTGTADVDTGARVLDRRTVRAYATTKSPYEGTSTGIGVQSS
jgi:simple sugar transport system substrate-binding protein